MDQDRDREREIDEIKVDRWIGWNRDRKKGDGLKIKISKIYNKRQKG